MSVEAVFFDIDGTLIDHDKKTASKTLEAINLLKDNGLKVIFATGRSPKHIVDVQNMFNIESYVCFNGALGFYNGKKVFNHYLNENNLKNLVEDANLNKHPMVFLNDDGCFANQEKDERIISSFEQLKEALPQFYPAVWQEKGVYQSYIYCSPEEQQEYALRHPELRFTRWHKHGVDVNNINLNKSVGIQSMLNHLNISPKNAVAFGDNLNDLEMLKYVGLGIAMGDGAEEAKANADFITKPLHEDGIHYGLEYAGLI